MGCGGSKSSLETVDDSVHVMLKHDKKAAQKAGKPVSGYVPRAEHPLLAIAENQQETSGDTENATPLEAETAPDSGTTNQTDSSKSAASTDGAAANGASATATATATLDSEDAQPVSASASA